MKFVESPYGKLSNEDKKLVMCKVSADDWNLVYAMFPFRGLQDQILATLFSQFIERVKELDLPKHYEPDNKRRLESVLRGDAISPTGGSGHGEHDRRREEDSCGSSAGTEQVSTEAEISELETEQTD
jgi:hypothetical protein